MVRLSFMLYQSNWIGKLWCWSRYDFKSMVFNKDWLQICFYMRTLILVGPTWSVWKVYCEMWTSSDISVIRERYNFHLLPWEQEFYWPRWIIQGLLNECFLLDPMPCPKNKHEWISICWRNEFCCIRTRTISKVLVKGILSKNLLVKILLLHNIILLPPA